MWSSHIMEIFTICLSRLLWMLLWIIQKRYFKWEVSILCPHNTAHFNQSGMNDYSSILKNNWNTQCIEKWSKKVEVWFISLIVIPSTLSILSILKRNCNPQCKDKWSHSLDSENEGFCTSGITSLSTSLWWFCWSRGIIVAITIVDGRWWRWR